MPEERSALPPADLSPNAIRRRANRMKFRKREDDVRPCRFLADIRTEAGSGVVEVLGHRFYYADQEEHASLEASVLGADTLLRLETSGKTGFVGKAFDCGRD